MNLSKLDISDIDEHRRSMDEVRLFNESQKLNIDKVSVLRALLSDSWIAGPKENPVYTPLLTDSETKRVKHKLFEIIEKL